MPVAVTVLLWVVTLWFGAVAAVSSALLVTGKVTEVKWTQYAIPAIAGAFLAIHYLGR